MTIVSMKALLETGVHFGHRAKKWNPKMKPYIFTERNGIHILDLQQTLTSLEEGYELVRDIVSTRWRCAVRGHEASVAGNDPAGSGSRLDALRQRTLAGRHAHQLDHDQEAYRDAQAL